MNKKKGCEKCSANGEPASYKGVGPLEKSPTSLKNNQVGCNSDSRRLLEGEQYGPNEGNEELPIKHISYDKLDRKNKQRKIGSTGENRGVDDRRSDEEGGSPKKRRKLKKKKNGGRGRSKGSCKMENLYICLSSKDLQSKKTCFISFWIQRSHSLKT